MERLDDVVADQTERRAEPQRLIGEGREVLGPRLGRLAALDLQPAAGERLQRRAVQAHQHVDRVLGAVVEGLDKQGLIGRKIGGIVDPARAGPAGSVDRADEDREGAGRLARRIGARRGEAQLGAGLGEAALVAADGEGVQRRDQQFSAPIRADADDLAPVDARQPKEGSVMHRRPSYSNS